MEHSPLREKILAALSKARAEGVTNDEELAQAVTSALKPPTPASDLDEYLEVHRGRVLAAMKGFLRVCRSGGMEKAEADTIMAGVDSAVDLGYFDNPVSYLPMESAPTDGTMVRLLANHPHATTRDGAETFWTIGFKTDRGWMAAGWDWCADEFISCEPIVLGWLPMEPAYGLTHRLFNDKDPRDFIPDQIKDRNGQVALSLCAVCNRAEAELVEPCIVGRME